MDEMTISKKLFAGCGGLLTIALLTGSLAIYNVSKLGSAIDVIGHHYIHSLYLTGSVNDGTSELAGTARSIVLHGHLKELDKARGDNQHFTEVINQVRKDATEFAAGARHAQLHELSQNEIADKLDSLSQANSSMFDLVMKGDLAGADLALTDKVMPLAEQISNAGEKLAKLDADAAVEYGDEASSTVGTARSISILMICLAIGVGCVVVYVVRSLSNTLAESIAELRDGADQVANAASQVSSSSQSLAQGASEQAASLEETSASSEEINSMARKNTDNSRATADLLAQSQGKVMLANHHLSEMVISMHEITESSGKISKIIKVIDEIAFQTNILALNAAVEAARAGEAGMGFAVVADEVRSLAQRSAQAAKDTATLIEDSISRSGEGKGKVDQVASTIQALTEDTARVKVMVDEVSLGSEEQSRGIDQIGRAIVQMEQVTQTTAANAEESAAAAEELNAQSEAMKDIVSRLHAMVDDGASGGMSSMRRSAPTRVKIPFRAPVTQRTSTPKAKPQRQTPPSRPMSPVMSAPANAKMGAPMDVSEFPLEESFQSF
ncbi:Methyl-accepting chemotaxis protein I (serine chemoreceptor protein) [Granulicella sibirica]|uniref:Methyl-accepting chemotaxis protein I (Serine chemoreceptor protein) n=2 Tax=Granulicella sibirica TaxID=2479048 RepID=A0A4Q0T2P1_9BACT|nr:Methyl-accepting chemotaxis protein I (serine chemoreceptor protein) [Granulicella sibirica]